MFGRLLKFAGLLVASWCVMTFTHEMGHIVAGSCCGGTLQSADLRPWRLPYSLFNPDPMPLVTLWAGPILGVIVPVALALIVRRNWMWFIAHFCVIANGTYIATAWYSGDRYLDTAKLLEHGSPPLLIAVYCAITITAGYFGFRHCCMLLFDSQVKSGPVSVVKDHPLNDPDSGLRDHAGADV